MGWVSTRERRMIGILNAAVRDFLHNWSFARWALASQLLASSAPYVMPWFVAASHGESQTGLLGACTTLVGLSNTFLMGLCNFLTPRATRAFAEGGLTELRSILKKTTILFTTTLGLITVAAYFLGEYAAVFVFGPQFVGAGPIITVLSLGVLANSIGVM